MVVEGRETENAGGPFEPLRVGVLGMAVAEGAATGDAIVVGEIGHRDYIGVEGEHERGPEVRGDGELDELLAKPAADWWEAEAGAGVELGHQDIFVEDGDCGVCEAGGDCGDIAGRTDDE